MGVTKNMKRKFSLTNLRLVRVPWSQLSEVFQLHPKKTRIEHAPECPSYNFLWLHTWTNIINGYTEDRTAG